MTTEDTPRFAAEKDATRLLGRVGHEMGQASPEARFTLAVGRLLAEVNGSHADVHPDVLAAALEVAQAWDSSRPPSPAGGEQ